ncbi:MAG: YraN family protein [Chromatiales bacterium]|nr:YraN family protein [Gammaproteobacteria bacterium]MBW6476243.1 YraN family protein [Chromatiales bacterium]
MFGRTRGESGQLAEQQARRYLSQQGLSHVASNYRCKLGEIDLIMRTAQGELVFVEVRYRHSASHGGALASVDRHKQQRLIRAASHYLQQHRLHNSPCRFDVLALEGDQQGKIQIEWLRNAIETA